MKNPDQQAPAPPARRRRLRRLRRGLLVLTLLLCAAVWLVQRHVVQGAEPFLHGVADAPRADCILVPGARIHADGRPYSMLEDRLAAALDLFRHGKAPAIVVSGRGGGSVAVVEVGAMRRWLQRRGVPPAAIHYDPDGLRTIDSLRNCRRTFGMSSAIVASNDFHVPRMVFLGRHFGLETYGVAAPPLSTYSLPVLWKNRGREVLARVRACIDVYW